MYAIAPPTKEPIAAAVTIGNARFLSATIAGVMNTSGGIKRNIDSHIVMKNTTHAYQGEADFSKILFINFMCVILGLFKMFFNR